MQEEINLSKVFVLYYFPPLHPGECFPKCAVVMRVSNNYVCEVSLQLVLLDLWKLVGCDVR